MRIRDIDWRAKEAQAIAENDKLSIERKGL